MILTCPQCATRYQIEDAKFPPGGRNVRCAKCGHQWFQAPPAPDVESGLATPVAAVLPPTPAPPSKSTVAKPDSEVPREAPVPTPLPIPVQQEVVPSPATPTRRAPGEQTAVAAGWIGLAAILLLIVWGGVRYRDAIASVWPQTSTLYAALGMPVNTRGIAFTSVSYRRETEAGQQVLTVNGTLVNVSGRDVPVPNIEVTLTDNGQRKVDHWVFSPGISNMKPGQRTAFATRRTNPPSEARHLEMAFAEAGG